MRPVKVKVSKVRKFLNGPTWYIWHRCATDLGLEKNARFLSISETKLVLGWFALYSKRQKDKSKDRCLAAYYAYGYDKSDLICPSMSGAEILDLPNRPCKATLYRRGFRKRKLYSPQEVEALLAHRQKKP